VGRGAAHAEASSARAARPPELEDRAARRHAKFRIYSFEERLAAVRAYYKSGLSIQTFSARYGVDPNTFFAWKRRFDNEGEEGLRDRANPRNHTGRSVAPYSVERRRQAVEAFQASGLTQVEFARYLGIGLKTLRGWVARYKEHGSKGLERRRGAKRTAPAGGAARALPAAVRDEVAAVQRRFPDFGLRKVVHFLARFSGVKVSPGSVAKIRREESLPSPAPVKKRRRKPPLPRRFERAVPGDLWQSDITSFLLTRHSQRVFLTVFLDDHSRYVVSFGLELHQRQELVSEALLEGIAKFGKPKEVLTDQGRQYFAWRGKSDFQKLLIRQGIAHVVARAHHPQTVGKCERLWKTVEEELWCRTRPQTLEEARERLLHYFSHYNHFRPHQGLGGMVPADRFFGAESAVRRAVEAALARNELALAVGEKLRKPVFLAGQIGDEPVSMHGERGKLVIATPRGGRREIDLDEIGMSMKSREETHDRNDARPQLSLPPVAEPTTAPRAPGAQASALSENAGGAPAASGAVGGGERGGSHQSAPAVHGDAGILAGADQQGAGGGETPNPTDPRASALAAGALGDGGGALEAAAHAGRDASECERSAARPESATAENYRAGAGGESVA
jgi:transposase InsO family protein/DNA-binding transcriptional regulator YiaG